MSCLYEQQQLISTSLRMNVQIFSSYLLQPMGNSFSWPLCALSS